MANVAQEVLRNDEMNLLIYPYNDEYDYITQLNRFNLDKRREEDIKTGKGFIISEPKGIKKDIKTQDGIYSYRYGPNSITDVDSFNGLHRCKCGMLRGSIHHGDFCENCLSHVRYVGDDVSITGYLVLKDKYWIIHPNCYRTIEAFIGATRLERIIEPDIQIDSDGKIIENIPRKKDEPFKGIGILEFKERFVEIMNFYLYRYPNKKIYFEDLIKLYRQGILFTHTIAVYSSLLRPSRIDDASLKYEKCNEQFNMLANLVYMCNKDKRRTDQKIKEKLAILFDIQKNLNDAYFEIKEMLSRKKGDIRSALGGRVTFSARSVIKQDVNLQCDQVKLSYHALCELLQQVIINILCRTYNMIYADGYKKWYKAQITGNDKVVYDIIDGLINDSDGGLPCLINRNPTISRGGVFAVRCVGINMDYTMSISLLILKKLNADFDGDTLNIWFEHNKQFIDIAESVMSPKIMYISNNDGRCDMDMLFSRDVMINANAMKYLCSYTQDQIDRIKMLQQMN